ncbi:DUF3179 domain-containing (seleno)protein [Puia sp. P3]|uniref:DUF3179 domain-containing (seleno)protein n=1 Tax=Puia sp. P3 TaxID=3423952 RepID=UPI003D673A4F
MVRHTIQFYSKLPAALKRLLFIAALLVLLATEILRVYFLMPFPGSQSGDTLQFAYTLDRWIVWIRVVVLVLSFFGLVAVFKRGSTWERIVLPLLLIFYAMVFLATNYRLPADKIFYQPVNKDFSTAADTNMDRSKLVIGIVVDGEARAYPIQLIGYHHQVVDTIGKTPVMVTYCTVCRSGRVFSPIINGKQETFRLVGMDHYNAVFEDATTKSWWQQATGVSITGPLKGSALKGIPLLPVDPGGLAQGIPEFPRDEAGYALHGPIFQTGGLRQGNDAQRPRKAGHLRLAAQFLDRRRDEQRRVKGI